MADPAVQTRDIISFGPFSLTASERLLTKDGARVKLGARTLDTLIALVLRSNQVCGKNDLLDWIWPDVTVDEGSLRFHIAQLRKALGDGENGARYIATVAGRGYCFVAPTSRSNDLAAAPEMSPADFPHENLPSRLIRMVGRDSDALMIANQLKARRFITILGAGGVGKTTVAVAVGHDLIGAFAGAVLFVDLGMLSDPRLVATAVASMLGLSVPSDDAVSGLIAYLRDKRILLILDTCEHLIDAVAVLASRIFTAAPQTYILATSREALRVEGEHVYRLAPLACPPNDPGITAAIVQTFPATQLFVERAVAGGARLEFSDADAAIVASICLKLDGVALAIELAARRVEAYGLHQTAVLLDQHLTLLWLGQRTAPPRQKTLQATLDWSYELLSDPERTVLRRLAIFVGHFTIQAALEVVTGDGVDQGIVFSALDSLIAKSMVTTRAVGGMMRYRLLDTTRAYALEISVDDAQVAALAARYANYYRHWLDQTGTEWPTLSNGVERASHFAGLNNVRAALDWCFGSGGDTEIGIGLAAAAAPVFLAMSLLPECHRWTERAILALDDRTRGTGDEMRLQAAYGMSSMFMHGENAAARSALSRSLVIAEEHRDVLNQILLLGPLHMFHFRSGDFETALRYARHGSTLADSIEEPAAVALARCLLGLSLHLTGDLADARAALEAALQYRPGTRWTSTVYLGFEGQMLAGAVLARTLWLQGYPAQAVERARQSVEDAKQTGHPVPVSVVLIWASSVLIWTGDFKSAEEQIAWFISHAESHSLGPYLSVGLGLKSELAICRGDAEAGVEGLQASLDRLHGARYELLTTPLNISLIRGLSAIGRLVDAIALTDETIRRVEANGDLSYLPELLRVKGCLLLAAPHPDPVKAEACFRQSLELSRHQGAHAWALRTATDLAALQAAQGRPGDARELLRPVFEQFTEGWNTADLKAARRLLNALG